jgi:hypothetical protein
MTNPTPPPTPLGSAIGSAGSAHTPLPWTYLKRKTLIHVESSMDANPAGEHVCSLSLLREPDAELIVYSVNQLPALRSAAEKALAAWDALNADDIPIGDLMPMISAMADLRTALNSQPKTK